MIENSHKMKAAFLIISGFIELSKDYCGIKANSLFHEGHGSILDPSGSSHATMLKEDPM
jgi:hypothetical protein